MIDDFIRDPFGALQQLVLMVPGYLLAVTLHEVAHGWVADRLGDPTARLRGRLTLNPLPHIDPLGALAFVVARFGWAKPVPVDPRNFRRPIRDMTLVAVAGPLMNFVVAFLGLVGLLVMRDHVHTPALREPLLGMLRIVFEFNLVLAIFNLIPLPPLDGGHFLPYFFPQGAWPFLERIQRYGPLILLLLVFSGVSRYIIWPVFNLVVSLYLAILRPFFM